MYDFRDYRFYLGGLIALAAIATLVAVYFLEYYFPPQPFEDFRLDEISEELQVRADHGDGEAQFLVGIFYAMDRAEGETIAWNWIKTSADQGYAPAQNEVGVAFLKGSLSQKQNKESACSWFIKSAEGGDSVGQYNAAHCYRDGDGVRRNDEAATRYFMDSARQGYGASQFNTYLRHRDGVGTKRNRIVSFLALRAAKSNYFGNERFFEAEFFLLSDELPVFKIQRFAAEFSQRSGGDWGKGVRMLANAAEDGEVTRGELVKEPGEIDSLTIKLLFDLAEPKSDDQDKEINWSLPELQQRLWLTAAHFGDQEAQLALSKRYEAGEGVEANRDEAAYWKQRAQRR